MIGCLWGLIKMKRSIGVNWAYRVTRGFAHCHMEHAEGPSAPFLVATLPIDYYFSFTSNLYLQNSFILSKIKNQKKLFLKNTFWKVILDKKTKREWSITFQDQTMYKTLLAQLNSMILLTVHGYAIFLVFTDHNVLLPVSFGFLFWLVWGHRDFSNGSLRLVAWKWKIKC